MAEIYRLPTPRYNEIAQRHSDRWIRGRMSGLKQMLRKGNSGIADDELREKYAVLQTILSIREEDAQAASSRVKKIQIDMKCERIRIKNAESALKYLEEKLDDATGILRKVESTRAKGVAVPYTQWRAWMERQPMQ